MTEVSEASAPDPIRALAHENEMLLLRLRGVQIPQHIGMAAASTALALDLPRVLMAQLDSDAKSGALAERWEAARTRVEQQTAGTNVEPTLAAVVVLLAEQIKAVTHYLSVRGEEWASDAHRLEGQAIALEAQSDRLMRATKTEQPGQNEQVAQENATGS